MRVNIVCFASVIWDTLKAVAETDLQQGKVLLETAGIIVAATDMSVFYDELGKRCLS